MFQLVIEHQGGVDVTTHPSREVALAELVALLHGIGCDYRVIQATWEHSSYDLVTQHHVATAHDVFPPVCGHAVIEEICACGHTERDHDDAGCTAWMLRAGRPVACQCRDYRPISDEPTLFDDHAAAQDASAPARAAS